MKRECSSLFAALLVSLLVNVLLRSQTAYWPRAGLFSAVSCFFISLTSCAVCQER